MSRSISRGPLAKLGVRPTARSTACVRRRRAAAVPGQATAATAFQKKGWFAKPTGSVR
jgi:hypothetical protein